MRRLSSLALAVSIFACSTPPRMPPAVPVFFNSASVALDQNGQRDVARAAMLARQYPAVKIKLAGYSLPVTAPPEPVRLPEQRAEAVCAELVRDGVAMQRIENSTGGAVPAPADTPEESRRVDIMFIP